jgi:hypothetical protein
VLLFNFLEPFVGVVVLEVKNELIVVVQFVFSQEVFKPVLELFRHRPYQIKQARVSGLVVDRVGVKVADFALI